MIPQYLANKNGTTHFKKKKDFNWHTAHQIAFTAKFVVCFAARFANFERILGFSVVPIISGGRGYANYIASRSPTFARLSIFTSFKESISAEE